MTDMGKEFADRAADLMAYIDEWEAHSDDTYWQCGGDGNLGSACIDDCCYGQNQVPCYHGDESVIRCDVCKGKGHLRSNPIIGEGSLSDQGRQDRTAFDTPAD